MDSIVGRVNQNPKDPSMLGIKNETKDTWTYIRPDGSQQFVEPGRSALIRSGTKIDFGKSVGMIQ